MIFTFEFLLVCQEISISFVGRVTQDSGVVIDISPVNLVSQSVTSTLATHTISSLLKSYTVIS